MGMRTQYTHLQAIVTAYREAGQPWPASKQSIALWAIREGLWEPPPSDAINRLADQLARAMAEEYHTDPQGRLVRSKHAARVRGDGRQMSWVWDDVRTAARAHMAVAFQQRRSQIVGDCKQLKTDVDSYNENHNAGDPIQLILDFTDDVAEAEATDVLTKVSYSVVPGRLSSRSRTVASS